MAALYVCTWLCWWAFLGAKLSGAWGHVSWWIITIPLDVAGALSLTVLLLFAAVGTAAVTAATKSRKAANQLSDIIRNS